MNNEYNVWCKWHPLKTVVLGSCYQPSFFRDIKNSKIRSALNRISEETIEDLSYYEKVLKDFGCEVIRPIINPNLSIMDYINIDGKISGSQGIPRSPLQPRDHQLVIGKDLYFTGFECKEVMDVFKYYNYTDVMMLGGDNKPPAPCYTLVGKDLYVDVRETQKKEIQTQKIAKLSTNLRINLLDIGGHNDGCFHTLKEGAIISLHNIQRYTNTFPKWDVCFLADQKSLYEVENFLIMKNKVAGKWWVPGEENNDEFTYFVETWLQDWVGYCEESVFDVNVLMLDDRHVCVNNYNETAFAFFKKHKIEPIIVPWRHRYFWDGGLHCITLDLYREGEMQDFFPDRSEPIIDLGFD